MTYLIVAVVLGIVAAAVFLLSLRLLIGTWLLQWLRGSAGLLLVALAIGIGLAAWDLRSYHQVADAKPIATLAFNKVDDRQFAVVLVDQAGNERRYQLTATSGVSMFIVLQWVDTLARLGIKPGYRLDAPVGTISFAGRRTKVATHRSGFANRKTVL